MSNHGLILVDKPAEWTSHDVVARFRRIAGTKKVGHAGTLDPMATGLLILGIGKATRLLTYLVGLDKHYEATIRLGQATTTDDAQGVFTLQPGAQGITQTQIGNAVGQFIGLIDQVPSAVSAIKVDGKRAYARVRDGEDVRLPPRQVEIHSWAVEDCQDHLSSQGVPVIDVKVSVHCSSGTYIRALARDLGEALGSDGHLIALRRTHVGSFDVTQAQTMDEAVAGQASLVSMADAVSEFLPVRRIDAIEALALSQGRWISPTMNSEPQAAVDQDGQVVAIITDVADYARPQVVFEPAQTPSRESLQ